VSAFIEPGDWFTCRLCIPPVRQKPMRRTVIKSLQAYMNEKSGTHINERARFIEYRTKAIHCKAIIEVDTKDDEVPWTYGFVQGCHFMDLVHTYGRSGVSRWEFHPLKSKRYNILSDCDGEQWPYYSESAMKIITPDSSKGSKVAFKLHLEDYFTPNTVWDVSHGGRVFDKLSEIYRQQAFTVWLVAIKNKAGLRDDRIFYTPNVDEVFIMKSISWNYTVRIKVDCTNPLGARSQVVQDQIDQPKIEENPLPLPLHTMFPPCCNYAQSLIWYPFQHNVPYTILVPPKEMIVEWRTWLNEMIPLDRPIILPHINLGVIKKVTHHQKEELSGKPVNV
jgi:hypothetical protein